LKGWREIRPPFLFWLAVILLQLQRYTGFLQRRRKMWRPSCSAVAISAECKLVS
jgi:hypothetical protein